MGENLDPVGNPKKGKNDKDWEIRVTMHSTFVRNFSV